MAVRRNFLDDFLGDLNYFFLLKVMPERATGSKPE